MEATKGSYIVAFFAKFLGVLEGDVPSLIPELNGATERALSLGGIGVRHDMRPAVELFAGSDAHTLTLREEARRR
jgi:hypothetical protein